MPVVLRICMLGSSFGQSMSRHKKLKSVNLGIDVEDNGHGEDCKSTGIHFFPPLYAKRYRLAVETLTKYDIKSVIDFGCAECHFVKHLSSVPCLEAIALVDINKELLVSKQKTIAPELRHFIFKRKNPLHVSLLAGSAEETDSRVSHFEGVTMIELIEHLYPDVLQKVTHNVFGNIKPRLCLVTTPNSEFNVLFKNADPNKFRHWDHKFEWNQTEFKSWCEEICRRYNYIVEYTGVGLLPDKETHHLGYCSQAAVFCLNHQRVFSQSLSNEHFSLCYELIAEADYPFEKETCSLNERIDLEVKYCVQYLASSLRKENSGNDEGPVALQISRILNFPNIKSFCDEDAVRESLHRCEYQISDDQLIVYVPEEENDENDVNTEEDQCVAHQVCQDYEMHLESWD
ncbi:small RNA 2'-O-methyltransferase-like isoform X4 [Biomphalaria glabrata]|uniref:Small RNA 2'-O-methyltransferase n=2 Tax=Biomphalaria glabrata TaxID=6526 RepID=A0A9W3BDY7_BIOGL|nr:small RNA 2'-O-methyltransferase-like isoform X4 [Biomphalaria glabrata]